MASERKENSVLFTLKGLKDMTLDEPAAAPVRSRPKKRSSFLDDADSLLASIRDAVDTEAEEERAASAAEETARKVAEEEAITATSVLRQAEVQARLAAEVARRQAAADERDARLHAADIAERRARGEIIEEPVVATVAQPAATVTVVQSPAQIAPPIAGRSTAFYLTVVGLPVLCVTAIAIVMLTRTPEPSPPPPPIQQPAVVTVVQAPLPIAVVAPIPDAGVVDAAPVADAAVVVASKKPAKKAGRKSGKRTGKKPVKRPVKKPAGSGLDIKLGGGSGDITF